MVRRTFEVSTLPYPAAAGSGGDTVESWDHVITTEAGLITALADADAKILFADSFSLTADRAMTAGTYVFGRMPGVVLTTGAFDLTAVSAVTIKIIDPEWDLPDVAPFINGGALVDSSANITLKGQYSQTVTVTQQGIRASTNCDLDGLRLIGAVADIRALGVGRAERIIFTGSHADAYFGCHLGYGSLELGGTHRADNAGALALASNYSLHLSAQETYAQLEGGPIVCTSATSKPAIYFSGAPGVVCGPVGTTESDTYMPAVGGAGTWQVNGGFFTVVATNNQYHVPKVVGGTSYGNIRAEASATPIEFYGHRIGSDTCGVAHRFYGGRISNNLTVAAAAKAQFYGVVVDELGSLTLSAGALAKVVGLNSLGTFTNSDPSSIVTLSHELGDDTTPATRRFNDAALDAYLPHVVAYWSGKEVPCANRAPLAPCNIGGAMRSITGAVASTGTAFDLVDATDLMHAPFSWTPGAGDFTVSFYLDLDVTASGEENVIDFGAGGNLNFNLNASGQLVIYLNGAPILTSTASSITTGGGDQRVTLTRVAGTLTCYVNGVSKGTVADSTNVTVASIVTLGANGANAVDGKLGKILVLDVGLPDATEQLLDSAQIIGAGA